MVLQPIFAVEPTGSSSIHTNAAWLNQLMARYKRSLTESSVFEKIELEYRDQEMEGDALVEHHLAKCHSSAKKLILALFLVAGGPDLKKWGKDFFDEFDEHKEVVVGRD